MLVLEDLITARNVFHYGLEGYSPNGRDLVIAMRSPILLVHCQSGAYGLITAVMSALIDYRVIASAGIDQGSKDTTSGTDGMGIDSLVANMVGLKYEEARQKELTKIKAELARAHEQHDKMMEKKEIINKQNEDPNECLSIMEVKVEGLEHELIAKRENKEAL
ncbi:hypothetical protein GOBAR_DD13735 [Gossypium barbadense]|nr:hypothetical protein GOBAR_DD13735 [Gossypium barbadense]